MKFLVLILTIFLYFTIPLASKADGASGAGVALPDSVKPASDRFSGPGPESGKCVNLEPFFLFHDRDGQFRVERLMVRLELGTLKEAAGFDPDAPRLRKTLYDLFTSGQEDPALCSQALGELQRYWGKEVIRAVTVSRSFLIIR